LPIISPEEENQRAVKISEHKTALSTNSDAARSRFQIKPADEEPKGLIPVGISRTKALPEIRRLDIDARKPIRSRLKGLAEGGEVIFKEYHRRKPVRSRKRCPISESVRPMIRGSIVLIIVDIIKGVISRCCPERRSRHPGINSK